MTVDPDTQLRFGEVFDAHGGASVPLPDFDPGWRRFRPGVRIVEFLSAAYAGACQADDGLWCAAASAARGDGPAAAAALFAMRLRWPARSPGKLCALAAQCALAYGGAADDGLALRHMREWPAAALESLGWGPEEAEDAVLRILHEALRDRGEPVGRFRGLPLYGDHALEPTLALLGPEVTLRPLPVGLGDGRWVPGWLEPDGSVGYPGDVMPGEGAGAAHAYIQRAGPWYRAENRLRFWRDGGAGLVRAEFSYASWPPRRASSFGAPHAGGLSAEEAAELEALAASLRLAVRPAAP